MEKIEKEWKVAQHLLEVSLRYTKTCDVILNLLARWRNTLEFAFEALLLQLKKEKKIAKIPVEPRARAALVEKSFRRKPIVSETASLYDFLRRLPLLRQTKENEFKKNVTLRVFNAEREISVDMPKLYEWRDLLERFLTFVSSFTARR